MKFAFVSRHEPTAEQHALAADRGIKLVVIGDRDAFSVTPDDIAEAGEFDGVVVVHPAAAMRLAGQYQIGVFENANRAAPGERPTFTAIALWLYDRRAA